MKSYKNLYPKIYTWGNLESAYRAARKGKRKYEQVANFEYAWESHLLQLQADLTTQRYQPAPTIAFTSTNPTREQRPLRLPQQEQCQQP